MRESLRQLQPSLTAWTKTKFHANFRNFSLLINWKGKVKNGISTSW